jgi:hypothetical protein
MSHAPSSNPAPSLSIEDRLDAIELFLQQLVLLLEVEPVVTAANIRAWVNIASARMRQSGSASGHQLAALARLVEQVA